MNINVKFFTEYYTLRVGLYVKNAIVRYIDVMRNIFSHKNVSTIKDSEHPSNEENILAAFFVKSVQKNTDENHKSIIINRLHMIFFIFGNLAVIILFLIFYSFLQ